MKALGLRTDGRVNPLGLGLAHPSFAWRLEEAGRGARQSAYRVCVRRGGEITWDTGRVESAASVQVPYEGPPIASRERYTWTVQVWDGEGAAGEESAEASWETGLAGDDWEARWIGYTEADEITEPPFPDGSPSPYLRTDVELAAPIARARAYVSALGLYELHLNGERVGTQALAPGWTDYRRRVQYQAFDVTDMLRPGANAVGAILADGWFAGHIAFFGRWQYGDHPALLLQLEVELEDGSLVRVLSGEDWRAATGPIQRADIVMGERVDARLEHPGWDRAGFDDRDWHGAQLRAGAGGELVPHMGGEVELIAELEPRSLERRDGSFIVDFGQNAAGVVRIDAQGPAGTRVVVRHGEMLDAGGALYTENLRGAAQRDEFILRGDPTEVLEPRFVYHGFRYAEISGLDALDPSQVRAHALSSALRQTGSFACSDDMLVQLQSNIAWGARSNFVSIPTDCPQRDERIGWLGDVTSFGATAAFNFDLLPFFRKWLVDVADAQHPSGAYPDVAPAIGFRGGGNAGWADAGVLVPWVLYLRYGDRRLLTDHYDGMRRYVNYLCADSTGHIRAGGRYGDWVSLGAHTRKDLVGTAFFAYSAATLARIAEVVGEHADAARYEEVAAAVRDAFASAFVAADGRVGAGTQASYVLALYMGLVPDSLRDAAAGHLVADIEAHDGHLTTGFMATSLALPVLSDTGHHELACRLAQQDTYPSWGFSVKHGATTIWERWDGWTEHDGFKPPRMNSFNHYALGAVGDWLYRYVAGLDFDERAPGYGALVIRPRPGGTLTWASAELDTPRGQAASAWRLSRDGFELEVTVPPNAVADVHLPFAGAVYESGEPVDAVAGVERAAGALRVGSGTYVFTVPTSHG